MQKQVKLERIEEIPIDREIVRNRVKEATINLKELKQLTKDITNIKKSYLSNISLESLNLTLRRSAESVQDIRLHIKETNRAKKQRNLIFSYRGQFYSYQTRKTSVDWLRFPENYKEVTKFVKQKIRQENNLTGIQNKILDRQSMTKTRKQGRVYIDGNTFLKLQKIRREKLIRLDKKPILKETHVGIEIECYISKEMSSMDKLCAEFTKKGLAKNVQIKEDGSINPDSESFGIEVAVLATSKNFKDVITQVCSILNSNEAKINKTCGVHVHLDMRNRNYEQSKTRLIYAQPLLFAMQPKSRAQNNYCAKTSINDSGDERYRAINLSAMNRHSTIEIRLHSGSTNAEKLINWVKLLELIVDRKKVTNKINTLTSVDSWLNALKAPKYLRKYVSERVQKHNSRVYFQSYEDDNSYDREIQEIYCPECEEFCGDFYPNDEVYCEHCDYEFDA